MQPGSILVIGYGNDLRGDDAAGQRAARKIAAWGLAQVEVVALHQLTPELADLLAKVERAIFLDAHSASGTPTVSIRRIFPVTRTTRVGHFFDPQALLSLAECAFGRAPEAWWVTIPALDFSFGAQLSPVAERGVADALRAIGSLIGARNLTLEATPA